MTAVDLTTATDPDGSVVPGSPLTMTSASNFHYFHIPSILFDSAQHYKFTVAYTGGGTSRAISMYSQPTPDLAGYNGGNWYDLIDGVALPSSGIVEFTVGPTVEDWSLAVAAGELYAIFEIYDPSPFAVTITSITWEETGTPPPPEMISVLTGTYTASIMGWNGKRSYFCNWDGSNIPKFKIQISEDWKTVTKGAHTEAFVVFQSSTNEVVDDIVPYRTTTAFSGANYLVRCMNLDEDDLAKTDQQVYPVNPLMSGNPQVRTMIVPRFSGEIYLISRSSVAPATPTLWKCTVDSEGNMTAFTSQGTMTYPAPGAWPGAGTNYHSVNMDPDPKQVSENIFYMGQNRGIWNRDIPLVIKEAYGWPGNVNGMDSAFDAVDAGMGVTSAIYMNPGHILFHQRSQGAINSSLRGLLTDVEVDNLGNVVTRRHWQCPDGFYPAASTWAKMPDGTVDAVCAIRDASTWRIFYNVFTNPTEWIIPASLGVISNILHMAPSERAGFVFGATINNPFQGNRFVSVQFGGDLGRLKVWTGTEWKYANPKSGENGGFGRLYSWNGSAWVPSDGMEED